MDIKNNSFTVSIVIPVYRGEHSIGPLVDELVTEVSPRYPLEIILVNDCSPDNAEQVCAALYEKHRPIVKFYSLAKNVGEHNAVMAGLNKSRGDWIVIMDDDSQNPVSEVIKLVDYAVSHTYDVVYTSYDQKRHSLLRNLGSRFNDKVANLMLHKPKNLYLSSFKAINRFLVNEIIKYTLPFSYIDGLILQITGNIGTIKVEHRDRRLGRSGYTLKKLISLWLNMFTNFSILPLRIATGMGFLCAGIGILVGIEMVIEKMLNPTMPIGYAFMVFIVTIFAATQLIAIGMVGEYLGRMFLHFNKKPQFAIRKSFE
jgi:undecaprenyl-phosphate 4-deoxy-4-formamido-L-arabinose transferase